jgi:hypothetical protein
MTLKELNRLDLSEYQKYLHESMVSDFNNVAGYAYYRLLNYICKGKKLVYDIGTYKGSSAIAMSSAKKVVSYDIENHRMCKKPKNVTFKIGDCTEDENLIKSDVIYLDTNHDGVFELKVIKHLRKNDYKGILILDDIRLNRDMLRLWYNEITEPKEDVTSIGHMTGTGIVYFGKSKSRCKSCG